jgi:AcrR family transcriptional regulator
MKQERESRRESASGHKRDLILGAARDVFAAEGLEGASLRAIATRAGYTPAALYFHFDSKEAIYAEVLRGSLTSLGAAVARAVAKTKGPKQKLLAAAMSFFGFYAEPAGLGHARDEELNAALEAALHPIAEAAEALGASRQKANMLMVDCFAHATGLLLLLHTGRIRMFGASAPELMEEYVRGRILQLNKQ